MTMWEERFDKKFCVPCIDHKLPDKALIDDRKGVLRFIANELASQRREVIEEIKTHFFSYWDLSDDQTITVIDVMKYINALTGI